MYILFGVHHTLYISVQIHQLCFPLSYPLSAQVTSQPLEHQSQSDTLMEEDIIVRDAKQPRLDFAILASMRLHSVDGSGRGSAGRGPMETARLTPVIETIHEDEEEAAQQDDFAKASFIP